MGFMTALSSLMSAILVAVLPVTIIGALCSQASWFRSATPEHRYTLMITAWALLALILFTAMNHQGLFWK